MTIIKVKTADLVLSAVLVPKLAPHNKNSVKLKVDFDEAWDGYGKSALFYTKSNPTPFEMVLDAADSCFVPPEVLAEPEYLFITIKGVKTSNNSVKASARLKLKVSEGAPLCVVSEPTEDVYSQLLSAYGETNKALRSGIANEAAERAAEIAVERARINNFAKLTEGSTTGDAELADIRIDSDGTIHEIAGDAVRHQVKKIKEHIELTEDGYAPLIGSFVQGGLESDGAITEQSYYASTDVPIEFDYDVTLCVKSGYAYTLFVQNSDGSYTAGSVKTAETRISKGTKFLVRIQTDPISYYAADVVLFAGKVYCETYMGHIANKTNKNSNIIDHLKCGDEPIAGFFDRGSLTSGNWGSWVNYRVCTPEMITYNRDITIYVKDGFDFAVHTFNNEGNFLTDSSWVWKKTIEAGTPFKVVIKRENENTDEFADVDEFAKAVYVATEFKRKVERGLRNPFRKPYICPGKSPLVGHRGLLNKGDYTIPENTVAAFERAGQNGLWAVEADIHETADGRFVCIHDATLDRTTTGTGNVADMTLEEIQALYIKDAAGNATEYKVPTFENYLAVCKIYGIVPLIEIKAVTDYEAFFQIIRNIGFMDTAMLTGGLWRLDTIRTYAPDMLYIVLPTQTDYADVYDTIKHYDSVGVSLLYTNETLTEDIIRQMHESDIFVQLWSINDVSIARNWLSSGADAIVTDYLTKLI